MVPSASEKPAIIGIVFNTFGDEASSLGYNAIRDRSATTATGGAGDWQAGQQCDGQMLKSHELPRI
ncbi:MAG: hypothetical protein QGG54_13605 [Gammaproteobacteria bacterium]|nr:hypothetical protein [Gammaproteobacteria bacterium]MDP6537418.1 hypothetical protein [Gammaproteobacteria bacterium]MDP6733409.1 hypothetical protein [Gammaproteobacteria bacterium]HAJ76281.1 hypothetical protein [Gammaproteobacteria bacterium]|tara:strand:- start:538 stop:735 length:198 start_codon:yes stop_codon:yes gene_type:complete